MDSQKKSRFKPGKLSFRPVVASMCPVKGDPVHYGIAATRITQDDIDNGWTQYSAGPSSWSEPLRTLTEAKRIAQRKNSNWAWQEAKRVREARVFMNQYWNAPWDGPYNAGSISTVKFPGGFHKPHFNLNETVFFVKVVRDPYLQLYYGRGVVTGVQWIHGHDAEHPTDTANRGEWHWSYRVDFRRRCNQIDREHDDKLNPASWVPDYEYVVEREMFRTLLEALDALEKYNNELACKWHGIEDRLENVRTRDMKDGEEIG